MIRKTLALGALLLAVLATVSASPAAAGGGASDYAGCIITVDPSTFRAGDTVTVTGTGLEPNFETTIEFNSVTVQVGTATTDATGAFEVEVTIPTDAADGAHTITAVCDTDGNVSTTDVTVSSISTGSTTPGGGPLPRTGNDPEPLVIAGAVAVVAGIGLVLVSKRRRRTSASDH